MKNFKFKIKLVVFLTILLGTLLTFKTNVSAITYKLEDGQIFKINNKMINTNSTYSDLVKMFGEPLATTDTAFGGNAYSFVDPQYKWYVYVETKADGKIVGAGGVGDSFTGIYYEAGDEDPYSYYTMQGTILSSYYSDYNIYALYNYDLTSSDVRNYWVTYESNPSHYLYELQKHCILASKVFATRNGDIFNQTYCDENMFYIAEQLKANGSSLVQYARNNNKTSQIYPLSTYPKQWFEALPNPILLGSSTEHFEKGDAFKFFLYDVDLATSLSNTGVYNMKAYIEPCFIDPSFLKERILVELTSNETNKLEMAKRYYKSYSEKIDEFNNSGNYSSLYSSEPKIDDAPISAGAVHKLAREAATDYLNTIRAGAGLGPVTLDEEMSEAAQHKAALVMYLNSHGYHVSHFPPRTDDVSEEFYNKAQSHMAGENLYMGNVQSSIAYALNDGYGDPVECGHRYNLINPYWTKWGVGQVGSGISYGIQSAHKFEGSQTNNEEIIAWPSNGVTPYEIAASVGLGNWSVAFYKGGYSPYTSTGITIRNLSNGNEYYIDRNNLKTGQKYTLCAGSQITFYDPDISFSSNDVFEITIHDVERNDGSKMDYSYRSLFYEFYSDGDESKVSSINVNKEHIALTQGQTAKIDAIAYPETATNKLMIFKSSNENVATVRQDGLVTAKELGETTITIKCDDVVKVITINVTDALLGDMNLDGKVNSTDAAIVLEKFANNKWTEGELLRGDMDQNGILNSTDAAMILEIFARG